MYTIYGKSGCPTCVEAKELLESKGVEYEYKSLGKDYNIGEFYEVAPRSVRSFPMIAKDGAYLGGLNELKVELS